MIDSAVVQQRMAEILTDVFMRDDVPCDPALTARDVAGWDSFKQVEIIMEVETRFHLRFTSNEVDNLRCLGDLLKVIETRGS